MCRLKDSVTGVIIDVGTRSDTDTAYHGCQLVGNIVAVQVQGGDYGVGFRNQQCVLQECVGNAVLDDDFALLLCLFQSGFGGIFALALLQCVKLVHGESLCAELLFCHFVTPFLETAFGKLHDVSLMHQSD